MSKEKSKWLVYVHVNKNNGKRYVGITSRSVEERWGYNGRCYISSPYFYSAIKKNGWDNFHHYILYTNLSEEEAKNKEIELIAFWNTTDRLNGYNCTLGGDGTKDNTGYISERISIGESCMPVVQLDLNGNLLNEYRNCRVASEIVGCRTENIRQCCNKAYGYKTQKGYIWMYKEDYYNNGCNLDDYKKVKYGKKFYVYDVNYNYIKEFNSAREAQEELGISYKHISEILNGKRKSKKYILSFEKL